MEPAAEHVYTPTELNREVRMHIEAGFPRILLEAEVSNLSRPASGHLYFTLKDERAQVRCALFRSAAARSRVHLENGMQVLARGRISLYEPRGDFQMIVDSVREAGEGALLRRLEELKKKLEAEGLFDPAHKRPLPRFPQRIGVVTSPRGAAVRDILHVLEAAVRDILHVLERRWPLARVRLYPVLVQGAGAPAEIREAILAANRHGWADVLICGRGGGSLEDLLAFNDESVARAVQASAIPVVSAVGHETDFSICDFVADLRAPTPSAAAELATPDQHALREAFTRHERQLIRRLADRLQRDAQRLDHLAHRLQQRHPAVRLAEQSRRLESLGAALSRNIRQSLEGQRLQLQGAARRLATQQPGAHPAPSPAGTGAHPAGRQPTGHHRPGLCRDHCGRKRPGSQQRYPDPAGRGGHGRAERRLARLHRGGHPRIRRLTRSPEPPRYYRVHGQASGTAM
jgi:exodeoxyribonuclease VII large subunit